MTVAAFSKAPVAQSIYSPESPIGVCTGIVFLRFF